MARSTGNAAQIEDLLYQALETELGGIKVYESAVQCALNDELKEEWQEYLNETCTHRDVLLAVFEQLGLDPNAQTPSRQVVAHIGASLVQAMKMAESAGDPIAAQLVAAECVVLAETKDHANWELLGKIAEKASGHLAEVLKEAHEAVEKQEDHHLYHT
ncbi:MAG: hypothetical protein AB7S98_24860, partial [Burkholderiaceae bacterium]